MPRKVQTIEEMRASYAKMMRREAASARFYRIMGGCGAVGTASSLRPLLPQKDANPEPEPEK